MSREADYDVVVIGAGAAGIGAGRRLAAAGARFLLLEARQRLGGRAYSDPDFPLPMDRGCSWLWGGADNPLVAEAGRLGFTLVPDAGPLQLRCAGRDAGEDLRGGFLEAREAALDGLTGGADRAVRDLAPRTGPYAVPLDCLLGPWMMGEETDRVSAREWAGPSERPTDLLVKEGLGTLIARLGEGLPCRLATTVTAIDWGDEPVRIGTEDGNLTARRAILTVSNGVLRSPALKIRPLLPDSIHEALEGLPMGLLAKLLFAFDSDPFGFAEATHLIDAGAKDQRPFWVANPHGAAMATGFLGGDLARELEAEGEAAAVAFGLESLAALLGGEVRRTVGLAKATRWGADPFAFGAYSVARPGRHHLRGAFLEAFDERLYLAGEAWARPGEGALVSGAYRSGWDKAGLALASL